MDLMQICILYQILYFWKLKILYFTHPTSNMLLGKSDDEDDVLDVVFYIITYMITTNIYNLDISVSLLPFPLR